MIKNKIIVALFTGSLLLLIISALVGFVGLPQEAGGPLIIKFDTSEDQVALLGGVGTFFGLLGVAVVMVIVNFALALEMYKKERFLSYALATGALALSGLFLVASVTITATN